MNEKIIFTTIHRREGAWSMVNLHSHEYFELYFLCKGKRQLLFEDKIAELEEGSLAVISPFTMHKTEGGTFERINLCISPDAVSADTREVLAHFSKFSKLTLDEKSFMAVRELLDELLLIEESSEKGSQAKKRVLCEYLMYFIQKHASTREETLVHSATKMPPTLLHILRYVNAHFHEKITLGSLSKRFFLSEVTLCTYFRQYLNLTFGEYISQLRLTKAKELLRTTKKSMDEIAAALGLGSANYFGLFFKKHTGISPLRFRKESC